jgi:hypothetical protein
MFIFLKYSLKIGKVIQLKENGWGKQTEVCAHLVMILKNNNLLKIKKVKPQTNQKLEFQIKVFVHQR